MLPKNSIITDLLVVGAGISGISTALEAAETGFNVILIEKNPYIGGRVAQLNQYFPKLCPPSCGLEINTKRLKDNDRIKLFVMSEVLSIEGDAGNYKVKIKVKPRYIKNSASDDECEKAAKECNVFCDDSFNFNLNKRKVLYIPFNNAYPQKWIFDKSNCNDKDMKFLADEFKNVVDLEQKEEIIEVETKSIVWATGWEPYNAEKLDTLGFGKYPNVITNMILERLSSPNGPTKGKIQIAGYDKPIERIAFVQCAGSRDENHLEYCSSICCLASMKQARYIREQFPEAEIYIYYIDLRTPGFFEDFYNDSKEDSKLHFIRGKIAKVFRKYGEEQLFIEAEDTLQSSLQQKSVDLVVLATGMQPNTLNTFPNKELIDKNGFIKTDKNDTIIGCGVCTSPKDVAAVVQESTAAAMKAIQIIKRSK